jgi:hypothetical protein
MSVVLYTTTCRKQWKESAGSISDVTTSRGYSGKPPRSPELSPRVFQIGDGSPSGKVTVDPRLTAEPRVRDFRDQSSTLSGRELGRRLTC